MPSGGSRHHDLTQRTSRYFIYLPISARNLIPAHGRNHADGSFIGVAPQLDEDNMPKLLTRYEAADYLGLSYSTLCRWASQRRGPAYRKIGGAARYHSDDLAEYLEVCKVHAVSTK